MSVDIIKDALEYYDQNNEKYEKIKKKIKYAKFIKGDADDIERLRFTFYDKDKKELFTSRIELLGKYYTNLHVWIWGWAMARIEKFASTIIRKVFFYGTDIMIHGKEDIALKNELITSRFKVTSDVQIDMHCAIASYLAKKPFIFGMKELPSEEPGEVKNEEFEVISMYSKKESDYIYYMFILDPPK
jgi:hypothetical protein